MNTMPVRWPILAAVAAMALLVVLLYRDSALPPTRHPRDGDGVNRPLLDVWRVVAAVEKYRTDTGMYPGRLNELLSDPLVTNWCGPYLSPAETTNVWGDIIRYSARDDGFEIRSAGPDRILGTVDDLTN